MIAYWGEDLHDFWAVGGGGLILKHKSISLNPDRYAVFSNSVAASRDVTFGYVADCTFGNSCAHADARLHIGCIAEHFLHLVRLIDVASHQSFSDGSICVYGEVLARLRNPFSRSRLVLISLQTPTDALEGASPPPR